MPRPRDASGKNSKTRACAAPIKPPSHKHELAANNYTLGALDFAKPQMREIPELIALMLDEVWRLKTIQPDKAQPHKVYVARFYRHQLSTGRRIGQELAKHMATCCRAAIMMEGGNRWQG
jgi:hypothetical protein